MRVPPPASSPLQAPDSPGGDGTPAVTVVITTRGGADLPNALLALNHQRGPGASAMEVVVVLDGAVRGTAEQVRALDVRYRLRVIEVLHTGPGGARDAGWQAATGPLILFLDEDVVAAPDLIAEHLRAGSEHGPCIVLGHVRASRRRRSPWIAYDDWVLAKKYARLRRDEIPSGIHYGGNVSLPRDLLQAVGGHDQVLQYDSDVELGDRLRARGVRFVYNPAATAVRHGSTSYRDWRRRHFLHGRWDVALRRDRGLSGGLEGLLACYHDRHAFNRCVVRLGLGRGRRQRGGPVDFLAAFGALAYSLRLNRLAYGAFSGAANLLYWSGVRDGMRGNEAFWSGIRAVRHHHGRPYLVSRRG